jgi:hypothetical protein
MSTPSAYKLATSQGFKAWTASDSAVIPNWCRGVVCLTAGNLVARNASDVDTTFPLTAGQFLPISPKQIRTGSTGTWAVLL